MLNIFVYCIFFILFFDAISLTSIWLTLQPLKNVKIFHHSMHDIKVAARTIVSFGAAKAVSLKKAYSDGHERDMKAIWHICRALACACSVKQHVSLQCFKPCSKCPGNYAPNNEFCWQSLKHCPHWLSEWDYRTLKPLLYTWNAWINAIVLPAQAAQLLGCCSRSMIYHQVLSTVISVIKMA